MMGDICVGCGTPWNVAHSPGTELPQCTSCWRKSIPPRPAPTHAPCPICLDTGWFDNGWIERGPVPCVCPAASHEAQERRGTTWISIGVLIDRAMEAQEAAFNAGDTEVRWIAEVVLGWAAENLEAGLSHRDPATMAWAVAWLRTAAKEARGKP